VLDIDARLYRTARSLILRPGELTAEFMAGRRRPWLGPLQLFLVANFIFFVAFSAIGAASTFTTELRYHTGQLGYSGLARDMIARHGAAGSAEALAFEQRFNERVPRFANSMVILFAPVYAALIALLHIGRRRYYVHHLVFALHFLAFMLLVMIAFPLVLRGIATLHPPALGVFNNDLAFSLILLAIFGVYLAHAARRAYSTSRRAAWLIGLGAGALLMPALVVYRMMLFFAVYFSLG
jgi:hypothetical protein